MEQTTLPIITYRYIILYVRVIILFIPLFLGLHLACERCPDGFTTSIAGATNVGDCSLPICQMGSYLNSTLNQCQFCPKGKYQDQPQETLCKPCPTDTSTQSEGM